MAVLLDYQKAAIAAFVSGAYVSENRVIGVYGDAEKERAFIEKVRATKPWGDALSSADVFGLAVNRLTRLNDRVPEGYQGLLRDVQDGQALIQQGTDDLINYLESLPRAYYVYYPFPKLQSIGQAEFDISDSITIVDTDYAGPQEKPLIHSLGILASAIYGPAPYLEKEMRYVRIRATGHDSRAITSDVASSSLAQIKHLIFISFSKRLMASEWGWRDWTRSYFMVIGNHDLAEKETSAQLLPEGLGKYLASISLDMDELKIYDHTKGKGGLLGGEFRPPNTPAEIVSSAKSKIDGFRRFFDTPRDNPDLVRIKAAIEWWIDAVINENQTISFLQYCLGFEALLGESGDYSGKAAERGITERLSDRYAYLLGKTQREREDHRKRFVAMYRRRGNIVHQRETHLRGAEDADACWEAKGMLFSAIAAELNSYMKATDVKQ